MSHVKDSWEDSDEDVPVPVAPAAPVKDSWEDEDEDVPVPVPVKKTTAPVKDSWEDEDEEDEPPKPVRREVVPESWEDEVSPTVPTPKSVTKKMEQVQITPKTQPAPSKSSSSKDKKGGPTAEEREAERRRQKIAADAAAAEMVDDFFEGVGDTNKAIKFESFVPEDEEGFADLANLIAEKAQTLEKSPLYANFVTSLLTNALAGMKPDNIRAVSAFVAEKSTKAPEVAAPAAAAPAAAPAPAKSSRYEEDEDFDMIPARSAAPAVVAPPAPAPAPAAPAPAPAAAPKKSRYEDDFDDYY